MATVISPPGLPKSRFIQDMDSLSTIRDPRSPGDEFPSPTKSSASSPHPDLNIEIATLSNKLISAINHQTHLDDALAATRQELEAAQNTIQKLDNERVEHKRLVESGVLVRKTDMEDLKTQLEDERKQRKSVEKEKKGIELELETLSRELFEEANEMVAKARKDQEATEKRNAQLQQQIKDTEALLASHQEQLAQLKMVMQEMKSEEEEKEANGSSAPSTPGMPSQNGRRKSEGFIITTPASADDHNPAPPTTYTHLLSPVLRTDLQAFDDFKTLIDVARKSAPSSRVNSGSYGGIQIPGLTTGALASSSQSSLPTPSNQSQPHTAAQTSAIGMQGLASPLIPLKETKFYKRALTEDIEPTLRLDTAPGLSWLARRTVINSMCEGTLVVEPMPTSNKMSVFSCALCGENRKGTEFARTHRFRTNESENAQRYPLCTYCLNRLRSSCGYLGFLRNVKDGHWKTDGPDGEKMAWEESVRLRERMFWARVGGGVVPAFAHTDSRRPSIETTNLETPLSAPPTINGIDTSERGMHIENGGPATANSSRLSVSQSARPRRQSRFDGDDDWATAKRSAMFDDSAPPEEFRTKDRSLSPSPSPSRESLNRAGLRESLRLRPRSRAASYEAERVATPERSPLRSQKTSPALSPPIAEDQGLQISIPGGFL